MEEEERPLMPRTDNRSGGDERPQRRVTLRGALGVFFCALVLFVLSSLVSRSFFYSKASAREESVAFDSTDLRGNLVSPRNGSYPTRTSTSECTTSGLPVLAGADVVEYFSMPQGNTPVIADGEIRSTYKGNLFFFRTANNRRTFEANPDKFIPAWGGFCSYGIAAEKVWTDKNLGPFGDPSKWRILSDGRLHVFRSETPLRKFLQQPGSYLEAGNKRWNAWFGGGPEPLNTACFCSDAICTDA